MASIHSVSLAPIGWVGRLFWGRYKAVAVDNDSYLLEFCIDLVSFGGLVVPSGDPVEQEKRIKNITLGTNVIMSHNVVDLIQVLIQRVFVGRTVAPEVAKRLRPYSTKHGKRFGHHLMDIESKPESLDPMKLLL